MSPRNLDLYPKLAEDHIVIVLYVHNRPQYLRVALDSLSLVAGINELYLSNSFPGISPFDCKDKDDPTKVRCEGTRDQYGNNRSPKIASLKHHWWWMMNTVWDGLKETRQHYGHILFIEEDHFIYPNAYRNLQSLTELKPEKCPECYAANLAPSDVKSREKGGGLVAERIGNVGYAFNRTVWRMIHRNAGNFVCLMITTGT
ncbi:UNVERIFIED_CONTAM: Alpha-1,6-mannosyl-glycoprotein 2-beta-N-acetylglucosaminyltransferase [Sesamum radiatum]|uniref:Alpha-1,6-mannosyl-glycoprotein 2-beta-N-acetylglucosaminyltransferase n=1 Tax=Sesamum radiatum TaxID=300843 RepID=A0AAW2N8W7_SESRA